MILDLIINWKQIDKLNLPVILLLKNNLDFIFMKFDSFWNE